MRGKRISLGLARRLDLDRPVLDAYTKVNQLRKQDRFDSVGMSFEVDERIREFSLPNSEVKGEVLLPLIEGQHGHLSYLFAILGHAFKTRGYRPVIPICDGDIALCLRKEPRGHESLNEAYKRDHPSTCAMCNYYGRQLLAAFGINPVPIAAFKEDNGQLLDSLDRLKDHAHRGVDASKYALATTRRFLKKRYIDWNDQYESDVYRRHLSAAVTLIDVAHAILENSDLNAVVGHHPVYTYGGVFLSVAEQYDIPALTLGIGYNDGTIIFGNQQNRSPVPTFTDAEYLQDIVEQPLSTEADEQIESIMQDRASGRNLRVNVATETSESLDEPGDDVMIGLFTNLIWDAAVEAESIVFEDTYEWVVSTVDRFGGRNDVSLIIKPHPAEALRGTNEAVADWLRERHDSLPENVTLLDSDTDVNPYSLMEDIDVGIVYSSTIGLEMAYHGIPVVVVNDTHYRKLGFTFDPVSLTEYESFLEKGSELSMDSDMRARAKRYAHFVFVNKQMPFPYYTQDNREIQLKPVRHEKITPGNEPFDTIVESVLEGGPVVRGKEW